MLKLQLQTSRMIRRILSSFSDLPYLPKWVILLIETFLSVISFTFSYLICYQLVDIPVITDAFMMKIGLCTFINIVFFILFKTHSGIIRYSTFKDAIRLIYALFCSNIVMLLISQVLIWYNTFILLNIGFVINFILSFTLIFLFRMVVRVSYDYVKTGVLPKEHSIPLLIYGISISNVELAKLIQKDISSRYRLIGFIDESSRSENKKLLGVPVYFQNEKYNRLFEEYHNISLLINPLELDRKTKEVIANQCLEKNIQMISPAPVSKWTADNSPIRKMKKIQIEDLLGRIPIEIDTRGIENSLKGKCVLITGAAGSIGSELVRQISKFDPGRLLLCDIAESPLHQLRLEIQEHYPSLDVVYQISDVRNYHRMQTIFQTYSPQYVYHAAAYKHVPLMEEHPEEAVITNILGTKNIADLSQAQGVEAFVMISTDKAVNPSNVMGTSKRIAEIYTQSLSQNGKGKTRYITTRFGNVLGSNGSVIPLFKQQIAKGGPVTVTHKDIIRYFMTIPEACRLVLEAGNMGKGGEIFVFDMGDPVRIVTLAERMIYLAGFTPYKDIGIQFTGLRPGEKLYEELLNDKETTIPTHNKKIMIGNVRKYDYQTIAEDLDELIRIAREGTDIEIVRKMKQIVPEFISSNSEYGVLDQKN